MKKKVKYLIFIIAIALGVGVVISLLVLKSSNGLNKMGSGVEVVIAGNVVYDQVKITKDNLPGFLQTQQIVKDIPGNGILVFKIYNYWNNQRNIEQSYVLTKGKVEKGDNVNADVIIYLESKYVGYLGDFCNTIKTAKKNNELGFESNMNEALFMWKYKGLLKYKGCFGL